MKSAIGFSTQINREVLAHKGASRESARRQQRRERNPRNTTSSTPVCLETICQSSRSPLTTLRRTLHANRCAGSSHSVHLLVTSSFPDEGLTTTIMDMEKLKKMQQSVRIGMCDLSFSDLRRFVLRGSDEYLSLFKDVVINS